MKETLSPEAYLKVLRIEDLEAKVEELARKVDKLENPKVTLLESTLETMERAKDEPTWEGWITNRAPTKEEADTHGRVAHYYSSAGKRWSLDNYNGYWVTSFVPWAPTSQVQQFTEDNPAPSPYDQEVSA